MPPWHCVNCPDKEKVVFFSNATPLCLRVSLFKPYQMSRLYYHRTNLCKSDIAKLEVKSVISEYTHSTC